MPPYCAHSISGTRNAGYTHTAPGSLSMHPSPSFLTPPRPQVQGHRLGKMWVGPFLYLQLQPAPATERMPRQHWLPTVGTSATPLPSLSPPFCSSSTCCPKWAVPLKEDKCLCSRSLSFPSCKGRRLPYPGRSTCPTESQITTSCPRRFPEQSWRPPGWSPGVTANTEMHTAAETDGPRPRTATGRRQRDLRAGGKQRETPRMNTSGLFQ